MDKAKAPAGNVYVINDPKYDDSSAEALEDLILQLRF